jgi:hypothetical protein
MAEDWNMNARKMCCISVASIAGGAAFLVSDAFLTAASQASFTSQAEARIGRPFTPLSVAGVARRTYRRAAFAGAVTAGAVGYGYGGYYGSSYPYGYGYSDPYAGSSYGYGSSYAASPYGYSYPYGYGGYTYGYPYASYGYYRPLGWRLGLGRW